MGDEVDDEVLRLEVHGAPMARSVGAAARVAAEDLGYAPGDAERVGDMVAQTCRAVAHHDFDDPDDARFEVVLHARPAALAVRIADQGLPVSLGGAEGRRLAASLLADDLVDRVRVASDGDGNAVTVEVHRDPSALDHLVDEATPTDEAPDLAPPRVERLRRDHLDSLARCTWRVYGHTYVASFLYHPEETWRMVEDGRLVSMVAVADDGEVVGHVALELERAGEPVADFTLALTDPRYRGHHVLGQAGAALSALAPDLGLVGTLAEAVTPHTITQRSRVAGGAVETGILLGFIPRTMTYRGFGTDVQGSSRQSAVLSYHVLAPGPARTLHLPPVHAEVLAERYGHLGLDRRFAEGVEPTGATEVDLVADRPRSLATIEVRVVGADAVEVIEADRRHLCASGTEVVHVELPLDDPGTPAAVEGLRGLGFAYAGFVPDVRGADVLRLQYLDVDVDPGIIQLATDDARRLLDYTLAEVG